MIETYEDRSRARSRGEVIQMPKPDGRDQERDPESEGDYLPIGDVTSLTTGGSGNSVEQKRYPYG
jgi:hypothetical protein